MSNAGTPLLHHAAVEYDGGVRAAFVLHDPVHDRVTADLLLAVAREAEVDRKVTRCSEQLGSLQQHVQLALVVGDSARVQPAVALDQLEWGRLPQLERVGRLHVEVAVTENRGRLARVGGGRHLADHERPGAPRDHLGVAAGSTDTCGHPVGRCGNVILMIGVGADGGDCDELGELGDELV